MKKNGRVYKKRIMFLLLIVCFVFIACGILYFLPGGKSETEQTIPEHKNNLKQGEVTFLSNDKGIITTILVEIAEDEYSRAHGLMFRENMPENQGMLFIFEKESRQYFWMKNTPLSLDMIYVNDNNEIVNIHKYTKPYSTQTYPSVKPAKYVVEVAAGFTDQHKISIGDIISWKQF
jgi:uncharacterized membrane protein (UPF0127 family)